MVQFDNQYRQIKIKVVYYGPAMGGKTTCLQYIHRITDPARRTKLYSLNTASDRTLFFDLLSLNLGRIRGYRLALQLYTVPGQVQYNATRRAVLSGADGVVFVADSDVEQRQANIESIENLWDNLLANGIDKEAIPLILHFNKRDLPNIMTVEEMDAAINTRKVPTFPSIALKGDGVLEGFLSVSQATLAAVADKLGVGGNKQAIQRLQEQVKIALKPFMEESEEEQEAGPPEDDISVIRPSGDTSADLPMSQDVLVDEAVRANMAMTDLNVQLDNVSKQLKRKVRVLEGIGDFSRSVAGEQDTGGVLRLLLKKTVSLLRVQGVAALVVNGAGKLRPAAGHGFKQDPLLSTSGESGEPLALSLVSQREPMLISPESSNGKGTQLMKAIEAAGFASAIVAPMVAHDRTVALLTAYASPKRPALDENDLQLASILATGGGMGFANAQAWHRLEDLNKELERQVSDRTRQLRTSLDETSRLANDLSEKNSLLEDAYRDLSELDHIKNELISRISHELKAPVTSLLTAAKILGRQKEEPIEKNERFVGIICEEAEKLSEIIQTVFQASVLASSGKSIERSSVRVEDLLRHAMVPLRDLAQEREVRVQVLSAGGLNAISCDQETMEAAVRAVIKNAIEFNNKGGEVKVEVRQLVQDEQPWLMLRVADSGVGIPEQDQAHIFDTFWQGSNVLSGKPRGVGLGLAIAKRVVENHGGTISVESTMGKGTQMTILVPEGAAD
jgi:signal transduction histidine kinase/signal recognition particle receptor subunit beta